MKQTISTTIPDWSREKISQGSYAPWKKLLHTIRRYQIISENGCMAKFIKPWVVLKFRYWSAVCGTDIPLNCKIGGGFMMPHPNGIVIHPDVVIGPNCLIFQQVTIGADSKPGVPTIGGHVDIGAGAKVLGDITIGDNVKIGANSVVVNDVPANVTVVGIPATIVKSKS